MSESAFIVPVPAAEPFVADLRSRLDPSAALGVPAHITLLHPFMAPERVDASVLERVTAIARSLAAFRFRLASIARFPGTLYLAPVPAEPFVALTRALWREFPEHPPYAGRHAAIVPHLTVGQAPDGTGDSTHAAAATALEARLPRPHGIEARCDCIELIGNASGRWRTLHAFALEAPAQPSRQRPSGSIGRDDRAD